MAERRDFTFPSNDGKNQIAAVEWAPESDPKAILQITHGMMEHIQRYGAFAEFLAGRGFLVVGNDHLGHGRSVATADDLGYFGENPSDLLVNDMHSLRQLTQEAHPELPYFMMGHSMGSFMLRKYLAFHGEGLAGAIIMGTGFTPQGMAKAGLALIDAISKVCGERHQSTAVANLTFGKDYAPYDLTGTEPERSWLSHNVESVKAYYADPLCGFPFTLNGYRGLMEAVLFSCDYRNAYRVPSDLPLLLVSGEMDPVGRAGHGVREVHRLHIAAGVKDLTLKLYPGMLHEILNEPDRQEVYEYLASWLEARV